MPFDRTLLISYISLPLLRNDSARPAGDVWWCNDAIDGPRRLRDQDDDDDDDDDVH